MRQTCAATILTTLATVLAIAASAEAVSSVTIDRCLGAKLKNLGKSGAAIMACYAKSAERGIPPDTACIVKAEDKLVAGFDKLDGKLVCLVAFDGSDRAADGVGYAASVDAFVGHAVGPCDGGKTQAIGRYTAAVAGCLSRAAKKSGLVDPTCLAKAAAKLSASVAKAETAGGCTNTGQLAALQATADAHLDGQLCLLDPGNPACPACGNGVIDPGEFCDPRARADENAACGARFACDPTTCNCACPETLTLTPDPYAPNAGLDTGWTGLAHRAPVASSGEVTLAVSGCAADRPCGTCQLTGPIANTPEEGQLDSQRCSHDPSIRCTDDTPCSGGGGTCVFYTGSSLPTSAGGVATCTLSYFSAPITGTADIEGGGIAADVRVTANVYAGVAVDAPCARCVGDALANDGLSEGTCDAGTRAGLACDANGVVPDRPDFGETSLDCPPTGGALLATLPLDLSSATSTVTRTLTAASPNCSGEPGEKCLCDTCNNADQQPCFTDADCPPSGGDPGICGGPRCLGGTNAGTPCALGSECPGGACGRPGAPTRPSACSDDTTTVGTLDCTDTGTPDGEGECTMGPVTSACSLDSGHGQRTCASDADCGGAPGSCESANRACFLTGGLTGKNGTGTLIANGVVDPPVLDESRPTLASVFCSGPTGSSVVNAVVGLPGPARWTQRAKQGPGGPLVPPPPPPPPPPYLAVGVIPETPYQCGAGSYLYIRMDDEDNNSNSYVSGWHGAITTNSAGTTFGFCKVNGLLLQGGQRPYAVLRLDTTCPPGSTPNRFHHFDNENHNNTNATYGVYWPSSVTNNTTMQFCLFAANSTPNTFPNYGMRYGVFAAPSSGWLANGHVHTDDEDGGNQTQSYDFGMPANITTTSAGQSRRNSELNVARVR